MKRSDLKEYIMQTLLEVIEYPVKVEGKFIKKTLGYTGVQRDIVCEGTITDVNKYAKANDLTFVNSRDSNFGGHYEADNELYEFHPNPEYYGEMMELNMSARDSLARISGTNNQVLTETDASQVELLVQHIISDETLAETRVQPIFSNISKRISEGMVDPAQTRQLLGILIREGLKTLTLDEIELSDEENELTLEQLYSHLRVHIDESNENCVECETEVSDPSASLFVGPLVGGGVLAENYNRMVGDHRQFL